MRRTSGCCKRPRTIGGATITVYNKSKGAIDIISEPEWIDKEQREVGRTVAWYFSSAERNESMANGADHRRVAAPAERGKNMACYSHIEIRSQDDHQSASNIFEQVSQRIYRASSNMEQRKGRGEDRLTVFQERKHGCHVGRGALSDKIQMGYLDCLG